MLKISGHFGTFRAFWRPFALQFQSAADDSLFCTEQGTFRRKQGISYGDWFHGIACWSMQDRAFTPLTTEAQTYIPAL